MSTSQKKLDDISAANNWTSAKKSLSELGFCLISAAEFPKEHRDLVKICAAEAARFCSSEFRTLRGFTHRGGNFSHILFPHQFSPPFRQLMKSTWFSDLIKSLMTPSPAYISHSKISYKFPGGPQSWSPHQDSGYKTRPSLGITFSVFLEECTSADGPIEVFPRSHLLGRLPHKRIVKGKDENPQATLVQLPSIQPVAMAGNVGDVLVFDLNTIHQSSPSAGSGSRAIFIFEVEPFRWFALESNGHRAIVTNGTLSAWPEIRTTLATPVARGMAMLKRLARGPVRTLLKLLPR